MEKAEALKYENNNEDNRKGLWMSTYTGRKVYCLDPREKDISILDIAKGLSNTCRYGGQCGEFYSVAQHCVVLSYLVPKEDALWGLLHDAAEAYITDIPRPIKHSLPEYVDIENNILKVIAKVFKLPPEIPESVKEIDHHIVHDEAKLLFKHCPDNWPEYYESTGATFDEFWAPTKAYEEFIIRFIALMEEQYALTN